MKLVYHISKNLQVKQYEFYEFIYAESASSINMLISITLQEPIQF